MKNAVGEIMSKKVASIDLIDIALKAANIMKEKRISSVIVVDMKKDPDVPLGIVTERDFVYRICAAGNNSKDVAIGEVMSSPLATITPETPIEVAADIMLQNKVRHLLVVDKDKKPIGIVAPSDLNKYLRANLDINEVNARILEALLEEEEFAESRI